MTELRRSPLTQRELEIAELSVDGLQLKEIAQRLNIAPDTVKHHRQGIFNKFGVRSVKEINRLFGAGIKVGLMTPEERWELLLRTSKAVLSASRQGRNPTFEQLSKLELAIDSIDTENICGHRLIDQCDCAEIDPKAFITES